jgi:uncharacterized OB-fold protein
MNPTAFRVAHASPIALQRLIALDCRNCPQCGTRHYYPQAECRKCQAKLVQAKRGKRDHGNT